MNEKTKLEQRTEKNQRYSAIDRHEDFIKAGYVTSVRKPRVIKIELTEAAKQIMDKK